MRTIESVAGRGATRALPCGACRRARRGGSDNSGGPRGACAADDVRRKGRSAPSIASRGATPCEIVRAALHTIDPQIHAHLRARALLVGPCFVRVRLHARAAVCVRRSVRSHMCACALWPKPCGAPLPRAAGGGGVPPSASAPRGRAHGVRRAMCRRPAGGGSAAAVRRCAPMRADALRRGAVASSGTPCNTRRIAATLLQHARQACAAE